MERIDWDAYFLNIAKAVAERSDCLRGKVGAVLVDAEHRIVSTGYPGVPPGELGCTGGGCPRGQMTFAECPSGQGYDLCPKTHKHAEWNCIKWADQSRLKGATLYITRAPCQEQCQPLIDEVGIGRIVHA